MSGFGKIIELEEAQRHAPGEPFAFRHALGSHEMFSLPRLAQLAEKLPADDYFVSTPAGRPDEPFYGTEPRDVRAADVVASIEGSPYKLLLKRLEEYDAEFRALFEACLADGLDIVGARRADVVRANSFIFLTGRNAITPLHFDPEYGFFMQIAGRKTYNLWSPRDIDATDLERHYARGIVDIGKIAATKFGEPRLTVALGPGVGLHQPPDAAHWVTTHDDVSVSYSIAFETHGSRAYGRTQAFNHFARKLGAAPRRPGAHPSADRLKALSMRALGPAIGVARRLH